MPDLDRAGSRGFRSPVNEGLSQVGKLWLFVNWVKVPSVWIEQAVIVEVLVQGQLAVHWSRVRNRTRPRWVAIEMVQAAQAAFPVRKLFLSQAC